MELVAVLVGLAGMAGIFAGGFFSELELAEAL